ncbi:MAG: MarR family winged helix-turn-helix transcriptional regulator [Pseudomonadaceae bacterium]|nr:MarR family winged helix-turn-helix transcriptional regulator [Pseudomonadaceae bacterium]
MDNPLPGPEEHPIGELGDELTSAPESLLRSLVHATYWLDDGLQGYMRAHAGMSLPRAQSMLMVYITEGITRQLELAAVLRVSKQAIGQAIRELEGKGIVRLVRDPENGRRKHVELTAKGKRLGVIANTGLRLLESELANRIGARDVRALRRALTKSWGDVPSS